MHSAINAPSSFPPTLFAPGLSAGLSYFLFFRRAGRFKTVTVIRGIVVTFGGSFLPNASYATVLDR